MKMKNKIQCMYCKKYFDSAKGLHIHIGKKHQDICKYGNIIFYFNKTQIIKDEIGDENSVLIDEVIDFRKYFGEFLEIKYVNQKLISFSVYGLNLKIPLNRIKIENKELYEDLQNCIKG